MKFRSDGIVEITALPEMEREFTLEDMKENDIVLRAHNRNHKLILVIIKNGKYSKEARKFLSEQNDLANKIAMVATTPLKTMIGNFFLGVNKPSIDIKLFNSREKAIEWLLIE